jgi:alpha-1,3-mannosyl-glycoprotein beta-1,2-N-acetylglucosaminyltransferase
MERLAIVIIIGIAWAWIMVFVGMLFYHGYRHGTGRISHTGQSDPSANAQLLETSKAVQAFAQETDKHQESRRIENVAVANAAAQQVPLATTRPADAVMVSVLKPHESPLLIFTCSRAQYLRETLADVLKYVSSDCTMGCPVVVSQDGTDADVTAVIRDYQAQFVERKGVPLIHLVHKSAVRHGNAYQALAVHYGWALQQVMTGRANVKGKDSILPQRVIILEEDLHVAPDFFDYFAAMAPILDADTTLLAVSAFNDNGFRETVLDASRVLRSDFFPGLGWMMTRHLWTSELQVKWAPNGYWDDWLREPVQRQGRHILHPEVSRTFHFGTSGGASQNLFGNLLSKVWLNNEKVDWHAKPPTRSDSAGSAATTPHWSHYLQSKETYDRYYWALVEPATLVADVESALETTKATHARIEYSSHAQFQTIVRHLTPPLMDDEKAGIPRTAYHGIVETRPHGNEHILFITPSMAELRTTFAHVAKASDHQPGGGGGRDVASDTTS